MDGWGDGVHTDEQVELDRRDVWSLDATTSTAIVAADATTAAADDDDDGVAAVVRQQRDVKKLGRLNVAKEASSVNPDKEQFNQARTKVCVHSSS